MPISPAALYQQVNVETASPAQLILMLYRRAIRAAREGAMQLERDQREAAHRNLLRGEQIVFELSGALKPDGGPLVSSLGALYEYFQDQLVDANLRQDPKPAIRVAEMLESLLDAWETAIRSTEAATPPVERTAVLA